MFVLCLPLCLDAGSTDTLPVSSRPNEGVLRLNVEHSSMASPALDASRASEDSLDVQRLLDKGIRDIGAVDLEGLCILPGQKVCISHSEWPMPPPPPPPPNWQSTYASCTDCPSQS